MGTVTVGRILSAHGVAGGCKCAYHTDYPERLGTRSSFILRDPSTGEILLLSIATLKLLRESFLIAFNELGSREHISLLSGWLLEVPESGVPDDTGEGEYYFYQLQGLKVFTASGVMVGEVINVVRSVNQEILEVAVDGADSIFIPFAAVSINYVDLENRRILLQPEYEL